MALSPKKPDDIKLAIGDGMPPAATSANGAGEASTAKPATKTLAEKDLPPEAKAKIAEMRTRIQSAIGQIVVAMSAVPRYRHQSFADIQDLIIEPLIRDRIAIAAAKTDDQTDALAGPLSGIAIWASVSDAVDLKIREQIKGNAFPIKLKPEEWTSGDKAWLLDVIAPSQKLASSVLANFKQVVKTGNVHIHPVVARMVDPELLKKMGAVPAESAVVPQN